MAVLQLAERAKERGIVRLGDKQSGYFADGSHVARVDLLPWTPFDMVGSAAGPIFKLLAIDWSRDMMVLYLNVPGGIQVEPHYHIGEAHGFIFTGNFEYEYGNVFANNYVGEGIDIEHGAILGNEDVLQLSILFGGLCGVSANGGPDLSTLIGCQWVYDAAKANGAADHIAPPPAGWRSPVYARYGSEAAASS